MTRKRKAPIRKGARVTNKRKGVTNKRKGARVTNRAAIEQTLRAIPGEAIDAARVQMLRSLAAAVDTDPTNAQLWKQYREALADLLREDSSVDGDLHAALEAIRGAAQMGDTQAS
ncbi:MAG: hypothetical protein ACRDH9_09300 [Actinomycetota bacterium]